LVELERLAGQVENVLENQQARCVRALVARVDYDGAHVAITLHQNGPPPNADAGDRPARVGRT
jgi:hypothetical protein